jgi:hypothetical protein
MQAADARAVRANQRTISRQIQNAARTKSQTASPVRGAGVVTLQLPGRPPLRAMMRPAPALAADVNKLRRVLANNDVRQARALARMSAVQAASFKKITERQLKNERDLARKMVQGDNAALKLISKEQKRLQSVVKRAERRQMWNVALVGTAAPLWALYADRTKLTASRNMKFLASNVAWLYADEIFGSVVGRNKAATANLAWLAVAGNIGTMLYLAKDQQHQRFVTITKTLSVGVGGVGNVAVTAADLKIAKDHQADFEGISDLHAELTYIDVASAGGTVELAYTWSNKTLTVSGASNAKVSITVDTWKDNGDL